MKTKLLRYESAIGQLRAQGWVPVVQFWDSTGGVLVFRKNDILMYLGYYQKENGATKMRKPTFSNVYSPGGFRFSKLKKAEENKSPRVDKRRVYEK